MYESEGKRKEAEKLYLKSLKVQEKILGESHLDTDTSYNNLAFVYRCQRKYQIAITYYLKAYKIALSSLGTDHPHTDTFFKNLKLTYKKLNREGNFEQWLKENMKENSV
ncbi:MAG: tetratricopeptide repeat protein [Roseburia sp.]|nr:tetratricopeptide repeat protein [Roseburia sp.]